MAGKAVHRLTETSQDSISNMLGNFTEPAATPTPTQVATALTVLIGIIQVLVAVFGLDFVTTYFSDEVVAGFTTGASAHVFITQLKDVFGLTGLPRRDGVANAVLKLYDLCAGIGRTNLVTLGLSALTILMLLLGKHVVNPFVKKRLHCPVPFPMELIAVVVGTLISNFVHLKENFGVSTVGKIPEGLPAPIVPHFELMPSLVVDAISISVVVMAIHVSLAKILAKKYQYEIDTNQEFYAMGFASLLSGFFPVFPNSCSLSRTMVSAGAGTRSQSVCVLRFDSPLLFTNVGRFRKIVDNVAADWEGIKYCGKLDKKHLVLGEQNEKDTVSVSDSSVSQKKYLIIDCSGFAYVDIMGVNTLKEVGISAVKAVY
ncbi:inorganic anion transporter, SulP family [Teladorsagia circumcincta]|uniref:Inorganic anion transporter, SulP family n=2 Tax=Teladorsagia circumcincta TaxID=45464 RepID=A0A2G9UJP1_TELCI|nr:inorganic anion transporter, SulP family [Teladorsagia circumcincta]